MKVIVISAHPDDLEIGCSGTLKRFQDAGATIISVLTVCPSVEDNPKRNYNVVSTELTNSYFLSGFELRSLKTDLHKNGRPDLVCNNNTMSALSKLVEECDIAILPSPEDSHQDHRNTYHLAWPLMNKLAKEIWTMHSWPYCHYIKNDANLFYNISEQWNFKEKLLGCYNSYFDGSDIDKIKVSNQWYGQRCDSELAEAFTLVKKHVK